MRVTNVIKDYIESEVKKKYELKLKEIRKPYDELENQVYNELDTFVDSCNEKAIEILKKYDMLKTTDYNGHYIYPDIIEYKTYNIGNSKLYKKRMDKESELRHQKDELIKKIILDLELGNTNKKDLPKILDEISF